MLASYGYVVVAPFHGDPRFTDVKIENLSDFLYALLHFDTFVEMQALRPLSLSRALDYLFAHPQYRDHLDVNRVGGFGASQGGESLLLMTGAKLTITVGMSSKQVLADPRLKAIVGYVPYLGQPFFPAFGRDQSGLDGIATPFLAISGGADLTAPLETTLEGVDRMAGSRDVVVLAGVDHGFDVPSTDDIFTWSMTFLAAHVNDDRAARVRIARMTTVRGGGDDFLVRDYTAPASLLPGELDTIEYFGAALGDYFLTAAPEEAAMLDAGLLPGLGAHRIRVQVMVDRCRSRRSGVPLLRQAGPGALRAFLHDRPGRMRVRRGQSGVDIRRHAVFRRSAGGRRLPRRSHPGHAPVQQFHGRAGRAPLPDEQERGHFDDRRRLALRRRRVLLAALNGP